MLQFFYVYEKCCHCALSARRRFRERRLQKLCAALFKTEKDFDDKFFDKKILGPLAVSAAAAAAAAAAALLLLPFAEWTAGRDDRCGDVSVPALCGHHRYHLVAAAVALAPVQAATAAATTSSFNKVTLTLSIHIAPRIITSDVSAAPPHPHHSSVMLGTLAHSD
jgi:hypothetical protein